MAMAASPTAKATRLVAPDRTSPAATTRGIDVSSEQGGRCSGVAPIAKRQMLADVERIKAEITALENQRQSLQKMLAPAKPA